VSRLDCCVNLGKSRECGSVVDNDDMSLNVENLYRQTHTDSPRIPFLSISPHSLSDSIPVRSIWTTKGENMVVTYLIVVQIPPIAILQLYPASFHRERNKEYSLVHYVANRRRDRILIAPERAIEVSNAVCCM
jgi:hypothetical protein